ncbi:MAG TPA: biotin carboxylase N-terminal domain-containing protein, partial [Conexibacter sp.]
VRIGPAQARDSYLSIPALLDAAAATGARAVHPGYGFLAESAAFARAVTDAGLTWIGPPPEAIELMGDKARAKRLAGEAGVPVVPGIDGDDLGLAEIEAFCAQHGFPIVVKAVAGGGGKGMRVVRAASELEGALAAARREAAAAFGDDRMLVERYLERPRHIEIQVLADAYGGVVHLGERECSLQRRHQKVVEESPSPIVDEAWRARMGEAAVSLTRACGYAGVGTVELIVPGRGASTARGGGVTGHADAAGEFFFLEMNTRLQVEHPVTELVYGIDLVEQQLRVAAGEPLGVAQDQLMPRGHAIEARLYAEDPAAGFLPSTGVVRRWREPRGPGVRVDGALAEGLAVQTHYDPMLAKVIAHGPDRAAALARLERALAETELLGVATNAPFTRALIGREDVRAGAIDTGLLERVLAEEATAPDAASVAGAASPPSAALGLARPDDLLPAAALALALLDAEALAARTSIPLGWHSHGAAGVWRRGVEAAGEHVELAVTGKLVRVGETTWQGTARRADHGTIEMELALGDPHEASEPAPEGRPLARRYAIATDPADGRLWIGRDGYQMEVAPARAGGGELGAAGESLAAPMPGTILLVHVADGDAVREGDVLVVMESMKMELSVTAPYDGVVDGLTVRPGDKVALRETLLEVHAAGDAQSAAADPSRAPSEPRVGAAR